MANKEKEVRTIYYTPEMLVQLDGYYKLPKWIMDFDISNGSKVLYALILDRFKMSLKNGWIDKENRVYMYFSKNDVEELMNVSEKTAYNYFKELVDANLIEKKRQGAMKANIIYLKALSYEKIIAGKTYSLNPDEKVIGKNYPSLSSEEMMGKNYLSGQVKNTDHDRQNLPDSKNKISKNNEKDSVSVSNDYPCSEPIETKKEKEAESETYEDYADYVLSGLNDDQYAAFEELLAKIRKRELASSKDSLLRYFDVLRQRGWKDGKGEAIKNIVGYVTMNFTAHMRDIQEADKALKKDGYEPGSIYVPYQKESDEEDYNDFYRR